MRGIAFAVAVERRDRIDFSGEQIVERHHAVGQVRCRSRRRSGSKTLPRRRAWRIGMIERADAAAGDQRLGADARQRGDRIGAAPQQRQRRRDHARAHHAENGEDIFHVLGNWMPTIASVGSPMRRSRPAIAVTMRSASA
jgi:hypothetical protein